MTSQPDPLDRDETFRVLFVCTGNICRSPMAERLLLAWLADAGARDGVSVASAGTYAMVGEPLTPPAAALVTRHGGDADGHRARQVSEADLDAADLVLAMTRDHRAAVAQLRPAVVRRVFTVREAGRLAQASAPGVVGTTPGARWRSLVSTMTATRGSLLRLSAGSEDVIDPYRRSDAVYEQCAEQIVPAVRAVVNAVAAISADPHDSTP